MLSVAVFLIAIFLVVLAFTLPAIIQGRRRQHQK